MQTCRECGEEKPQEDFSRNSNYKNGYQPTCKSCRARKEKARREKDGERINLLRRLWRSLHKDRLADQGRRYRQKYPERLREKNRRYQSSNREKVRKWVREWGHRNSEKIKEIGRQWAKLHPDRIASKNRNRRAQEKGSASKISPQEWEDLKREYDYTCLRCEKREPEIKLTLDHVIPLSLGGEHTIKNAQPLCLSCNDIKSTKTTDYRKKG